MKRYLPALFLTLLMAVTAATDGNAQAKGSPESFVAIAKAAAYKPGQDFTWIFDQNCKPPAPPAPQARPAAQAAPAQPDYTAELEQLAQLKAQGILTEEEFEAKKKQILGL